MPKLLVVLVVCASAWLTDAEVRGLPQLDLNEWWGPYELIGKTNDTINEFKVTMPTEMVKDLRYRLRNHRKLAAPLENVAFEYGFNTNQIEPWVNYWAEEYNFTEREAFFNRYSHFTTNIQGLNIHFVHVKPKAPRGVKVVPLLMLHGFRGSFREFFDAIPYLITPKDGIVCEVIVPCLPGFGFSDGAVRPGLGPAEMAVVFRNLMQRLGHDQYYVHAGDMGSLVGAALVTLFQDEVLGYHTCFQLILNSCTENSILAGLLSAAQDPSSPAVPSIEEGAYIYFQATKPDTIVHPKYGVVKSMPLHLRASKGTLSRRSRIPTSVATWVVHPIYDLLDRPTNYLKFSNVVGDTSLPAGHYLAMELPQEFSDNVFQALKAFMKCNARTDL